MDKKEHKVFITSNPEPESWVKAYFKPHKKQIYRVGNSWFDSLDGDSPDCRFIMTQEQLLQYKEKGLISYKPAN